MASDDKTPEGFSLKRWSRRKLEATREAAAAEMPAPAPSVTGPVAQPPAASATGAPGATPAAEVPTLPPIEALTSESDFAAFMHPKVDEGLRRQALKKLFTDPRSDVAFRPMDPITIYLKRLEGRPVRVFTGFVEAAALLHDVDKLLPDRLWQRI